jgi:hypothetical protein
MESAQVEMPRYRSHKTVWALKIARVEPMPIADASADTAYQLHFEDKGYAPRSVSGSWFTKHLPQAGGYFVVYQDGYESYSPAKAFDEGYTRIES